MNRNRNLIVAAICAAFTAHRMFAFDSEAFLSQTTSEAGSTDYTPLPDADWSAQIAKVQYREAKDTHVLDIFWEVSDPRVKEITGRDKVQIKQGVFLDLLPNGGLDMGKGMNVQLNRVRDVLGQNNPGQVWAPRNLIGGTAKITTSSRSGDGGRVYNDVKAVAKL